jgi:prepilin peptidase CpaA
MPLNEYGILTIAAFICVMAAATDLVKFKVYNALTFPALAAGLLTSTLIGGWIGLAQSLAGAAAGFSVLVLFFAMGGVGAGDVKLLTALGAWLGPVMTIETALAAVIAAGVYASILVVVRGDFLFTLVETIETVRSLRHPSRWRVPSKRVEHEVSRPDRRRRLVPFAAMTCIGYFAVLTWR